MEKADILEMTVAHLKSLQHRQLKNDPKVRDHGEGARCHDSARYVLGFRECANEVEKYLATLNPVDRPGAEVLSSLIQYLGSRIENVQKAARNGSDQLHPVLESSEFARADSLIQFQTVPQSSNIVARECKEFQPTATTGRTCFRIGDSSMPASATATTRYILGQLPYLQHPYAALTPSLPISDQSHFVTAAATPSTLVRREHMRSPTQGDEFPQALGVRIPGSSGILQFLRDAEISRDSGISLDSPAQIYRSKSVKGEPTAELSSQSAYKVKPSSQMESTTTGPSTDCLWRPW